MTQRDGWTSRKAWWPIPLLLAVIAGLWVADLRTAYESRALMTLLNFFFTWLASLCICLLAARGFMWSGQPGLLMFGCGSLLWGVTSLSAAMVVDRMNLTITVHNVGVFVAALCHLVGLLWRGRLPRPGRWLVVGYAGALLAAAFIFWAAAVGLTPRFFVQGQGGTLVREVILVSAITIFAWVAHQMIYKFWRQSGAFYYWYGLGLALVATGLTGVVLLSVQGSILGWTNRLTQYLGSAYLFIAAVAAARDTGWKLSLSAVEESWLRKDMLPSLQNKQGLRLALRYGSAVLAVAVSCVVHITITARFGPGFPAYILLVPTMLAVIFFARFWPGVIATLLADLVTAYWILPPTGQFAIASPIDRLGLLAFTGVGLFCCAFIELFRRASDKATAFDREAVVRENRERLAMFAEATFEGIVESVEGRIVDCNEQFAQMLGYSVEELTGVEIGDLVAPEHREMVTKRIKEYRESEIENELLRKDGTRVVVEAHGRPVLPGSARRHTAVRDVTARKRAEEVAAKYDLLSQYARDSLLLIETSGNIIEANQAAVEFYGYSREVLLELNIKDLRRDYDAEKIQDQIRKAISGGILFETAHFRKDGTLVLVEVSSTGVVIQNRQMILSVVRDITERKLVEQALRESRAQLDLALVSARMATFDWDIVKNKRTWSDGVHSLLGTTADTFTGTAEEFFAIMHPEDRSKVQADLDRAVETTGDYETEYRAVWPDGNIRHIGARGKVHYGRAGQAVLMTGVCWDITERKQVEEALVKANRQTQNLIDNTTAIVYAFDLEERFVLANAAIAKLLNSTPAQMIGKRRHDFMPQEDADWHESNDRKVIEAGKALDFEEQSGLPGRSITWLTTKFPLCDAEGKIYAVGGFSTDITERKRAEEALRQTIEELQTTMDVVPVAIWVSRDPQCHEIIGNFTANQFYEAGKGENVSAGPADGQPAPPRRFFRDGKELTAAELPMQKAAAKDVNVPGTELEVELPSGRWLTMFGAASPLRDIDGKVRGCVGAFMDTTKHKQAERALQEAQAKLKAHAENLEKIVAERTAKLLEQTAEHDKLQQEILRISEREKQIISQELHDGLCQNLAGTALMSRMLHNRLSARNDPDAKHAKEIYELLSIGVNEARNLSHGLHPVGPHGEGLMNALSQLAGTVRNLFHIDCTFDCPRRVSIENEMISTHLFRITQEAINNARKHGEADRVVIDLRRTREGVTLTIQDNGVGIPEKTPEKSGMGLRIMNNRASDIGATLTVCRAGKNGGTVVTCTLPAHT